VLHKPGAGVTLPHAMETRETTPPSEQPIDLGDPAISIHPFPVARDCVMVIQGGGLNGLPLLGQAGAFYEQGFLPAAFAGTSAGAIIAALLWSGLYPPDVRAKLLAFAEANPKVGLAALLDPAEPPPKPPADPNLEPPTDPSFDQFSDWLRLIGSTIRNAFPSSDGKPDPLETIPSRLGRWWRAFRGGRKVYRQAEPLIARLGVFSGGRLTEVLDDWIKEGVFGKVIKDGGRELDPTSRFCPASRHLTFRDVARFDEHRGVVRAPLFITATNLRTRTLELIDSFNRACENTPIASAARASGSAPFFFRPVPIPQANRGGLFVDGGLVSNFPAWVFADNLWREAPKHPALRAIIRRPLIHIGLRVTYPERQHWSKVNPQEFLSAILGIASGGARNQLEEMIVSATPRPLTVRQYAPTIGGPDNVFDFNGIDAQTTDSMIRRGYECGRTELEAASAVNDGRVPSIYDPAGAPEAALLLQDLARQTRALLSPKGPFERPTIRLRVSLFLPFPADVQSASDSGSGSSSITLRLAVGWGMTGHPDSDLAIRLETGGVIGFCYENACGAFANLEEINRLRTDIPTGGTATQPISPLLFRDENLRKTASVTPPVRSLLTCPVYDIYRRDAGERGDPPVPLEIAPFLFPFRASSNAALLGILNLDCDELFGHLPAVLAGPSAPPENQGIDEGVEPSIYPEDWLASPIIRGMLVMVQATAAKLAPVISDRSFGAANPAATATPGSP
jgi:predicted acylesterase/phospholipase RssA